jgi:alkanesulfonate monooxygenase SsuD/methylene tetrahydromethanopterin reductase-like flavin-dependent oxidoreductase (luciferase family)
MIDASTPGGRPVRFGIFYEHQLPRPWAQSSERDLLHDALEQVEIADRVGFDHVWEVEHHFLEEYSHSSAPEVFLAAASQRTKRIRLGHGIVQLPPAVNHPARVAERVATLDLISDGRVDFGTGESSSAAEIGGFEVQRSRKREQWQDALDAITRMFVEEPFAGWSSRDIDMPPRNVVPKPRQRPHPPLWVACSRRETIELAARNGIGALSFSFVEPEDAAPWVQEYYRLIASPECVPAGFAVNANITVVLPMMCHEDEAEAIERGIDGAHFFGYSLAHYYGLGAHQPGHTDVWDEFQRRRGETGFAREVVKPDMAPLGVRILQAGVGSLRGAIGTPQQIAELARRYEAVGVDQIVFVLQAGRNRHEHICESLELFGREVLPAFVERAEASERDKAARLEGAIDAALARRAPPRRLPVPYTIDETAELARAGRRARAATLDRDDLTRRAGEGVRDGARRVLEQVVRGASDEQLQRRFGNRVAQKAIFAGMARSFQPQLAGGFQGDIVYELSPSAGNGRARTQPDRWTLSVRDGRATAQRGGSPEPAVVLRMGVADFARLLSGVELPLKAMIEGRASVEGDFTVVSRLSEMFGGPSPW